MFQVYLIQLLTIKLFALRQIRNHFPILDNQFIRPSSSIFYLGLKLDSKLRWIPHFQFLKVFDLSLCSVTGVRNWGSHPSCLLHIFNSIIKSKAHYSSFLFTSASLTHRKKLNSIIIFSCFCVIIEAIHSSPLSCLKVECCCPIEIRSRSLVGKFLLKSLAAPDKFLFHLFTSMKSSWTYVPKTLPS